MQEHESHAKRLESGGAGGKEAEAERQAKEESGKIKTWTASSSMASSLSMKCTSRLFSTILPCSPRCLVETNDAPVDHLLRSTTSLLLNLSDPQYDPADLLRESSQRRAQAPRPQAVSSSETG